MQSCFGVASSVCRSAALAIELSSACELVHCCSKMHLAADASSCTALSHKPSQCQDNLLVILTQHPGSLPPPPPPPLSPLDHCGVEQQLAFSAVICAWLSMQQQVPSSCPDACTCEAANQVQSDLLYTSEMLIKSWHAISCQKNTDEGLVQSHYFDKTPLQDTDCKH